jgi:hypothetical protein
MGRKKIADPKNVQIRITRRLRRELAIRKTNYHMPARYKEGDIMEAVLWILQSTNYNKINKNNKKQINCYKYNR